MTKLRIKVKQALPPQKQDKPNNPTTTKERIRTINRTPRPMGLTYLCRQIHTNERDNKELNKRLLYKAKYLLSNHFLTNGLKHNNYQVSLNEYLMMYGITRKEYDTIYKDIVRRTMGVADLANMEDVTQGLKVRLLGTIFWALGDKHQVNSQLQLLLASQGDTYKPFVSTEVNKLLKTNLDATKNMADIIRSLLPQAGLTINNNISQINKDTVTVEKAITIFENEPTMFTLAAAGNLPPLMIEEAQLGNLPDISAISQNSETTGQVTFNKKELRKARVTHENRREALNETEDIDLDD